MQGRLPPLHPSHLNLYLVPGISYSLTTFLSFYIKKNITRRKQRDVQWKRADIWLFIFYYFCFILYFVFVFILFSICSLSFLINSFVFLIFLFFFSCFLKRNQMKPTWLMTGIPMRSSSKLDSKMQKVHIFHLCHMKGHGTSITFHQKA